MRGKAERTLADAIAAILSHPVYSEWIKDQTTPKHFRDAGHFWGIAVGTPPRIIQKRIAEIDRTLESAQSMLSKKGRDEVASRGQVLFNRADVQRATEFQAMLKSRFAKELSTLQAVVT